MPYVNIKVTPGDVTSEQKAALIKGTTDVLVNVLDKNPEYTFVLIDELSPDNWGIGGETVALRKQKREARS